MVSLTFSPDDRYLAAVTDDHYVRIFKKRGQLYTPFQTFFGSTARILSKVVFSSDNDLLVYGSTDGKVRVWQRSGVQDHWHIKQTIYADKFSIRSLALSPKQQYLATGADSGHVALWKNHDDNWSLQELYKKQKSRINDLAFNYDGKYLASTSTDWVQVRRWTGTSYQTLPPILPDPSSQPLRNLVYGQQSSVLAYAGEDGLITLWHEP